MMAKDQDSESKRSWNRSCDVVFGSAQFNMVHPGQLRLLRLDCGCEQRSVVGALPDSNLGASVAVADRLRGLSAA